MMPETLAAGKKYRIGMYGGKFLPFHKGHRYCVEVAARECETVYVILFYGGPEEESVCAGNTALWLSAVERKRIVKEICRSFSDAADVIPAFIDISKLRLPDGSEDWEAETPLVRKICGDRLDAVYSSEVSYGEYFSGAYPEAVHRLVDVPRIHYPISGTAIRNFDNEDERRKWML